MAREGLVGGELLAPGDAQAPQEGEALQDEMPPVPVQGDDAAELITSAIRGFNKITNNSNLETPDVIIVARGGGSIEDLWPFNEENVVRSVFESQIPIVSAVGHETDITLIDYVSDLRQRKKDRVFWELTKTRDGYAKHLSRHFNEKYLRAVGVWERTVKVLYCTRHTFINALYQNKVDENVIKALVGHEKEFTMKHYGGEPFSPDRLLQEVSKVTYKGIKFGAKRRKL